MEDIRNKAWRMMNKGLSGNYRLDSYGGLYSLKPRYPEAEYSYEALVAAFRSSPVLKEYFNLTDTDKGISSRQFRYHERKRHGLPEKFDSFCFTVPSPKNLPRYSSAKTIFVWHWKMEFVSISQLVPLLERVLPKLAEAELAVLDEERQFIKEEKMRNLVEGSFDDAVKEMFRGSGLKYSYEYGPKMIKLTVRLPRKQKMTINLHHSRISEELIRVLPLVKSVHQAISEMETLHIKISGYGNNERWIDSEQ